MAQQDDVAHLVATQRKSTDSLVNRFGKHVPYKTKVALWHSYDFHVQSLSYAVARREENLNSAQIDDLLIVVALSAIYRQIFLQIDGIARFTRRLGSRYNLDGVVAGTSVFDQERAAGMLDIVDAFQRLVARMRVPVALLDYTNCESLISMYLDDDYADFDE